MIINITLNFYFIPIFGISGAAIATSTALGSKNFMNFILMYKRLKIHPYDKSFLKLLLVAVISIAIIFPLAKILNINFVIKLVVSGVIYSLIFASLIYKFVMSEYEIKILKRELRKLVIRKGV